jgi:hypothetical protein
MTTIDRSAFEAVAEKMDLPPLPKFDLPPFVRHVAPERRDPDAYDWWHVEPTSDGAADFKLGMRYFFMAMALEHALQRPDITALVTTCLVTKGQMTSVEAGFMFPMLEHARTIVLH